MQNTPKAPSKALILNWAGKLQLEYENGGCDSYWNSLKEKEQEDRAEQAVNNNPIYLN